MYKICSACFCFYCTSFVTCGRILIITWRTPGSFLLPHSEWVSFLKVPLYLGWPKCSLGFLDNGVWKNPNELYGQPDTSVTFRSRESTQGPQCCNELPQVSMKQAERKVTSTHERRAADSTTASRVALRANESALSRLFFSVRLRIYGLSRARGPSG